MSNSQTLSLSPIADNASGGREELHDEPTAVSRVRQRGRDLLPGLMGLRGVAALMIVLFHLVHLAPQVQVPSVFFFVKSHFNMSVPLFFVLSGYSLMYSTKRSAGQSNWVQNYFIKRIFRIVPTFYLMLFFFSIYNYFAWGLSPSVGQLIINVLFVYGLVPGQHESIVWAGWTVGVEMLFYALFPVLLVVTTRLRYALLLVVVCTVAGIAARNILAGTKNLGNYGELSFISNAFTFTVGIAAYMIYEQFRTSRTGGWVPGVVCSTVAVGIVAILMGPLGLLLSAGMRFDLVVWTLLFGFIAVWQTLWPSRILCTDAMQFCGNHSYSIYLVHPMIVLQLAPAYRVIYATLGSNIAAFLVSCALGIVTVLAVAAVVHRFIEAPGIRLGARLIQGLKSGTPFRELAAAMPHSSR